jgi:hypothetical protein
MALCISELLLTLKKLTQFFVFNPSIEEHIYSLLFDEMRLPSDGYSRFRDWLSTQTEKKYTLNSKEASNIVLYATLYLPQLTEVSRDFAIAQLRRKCVLRPPSITCFRRWTSEIKSLQSHQQMIRHSLSRSMSLGNDQLDPKALEDNGQHRYRFQMSYKSAKIAPIPLESSTSSPPSIAVYSTSSSISAEIFPFLRSHTQSSSMTSLFIDRKDSRDNIVSSTKAFVPSPHSYPAPPDSRPSSPPCSRKWETLSACSSGREPCQVCFKCIHGGIPSAEIDETAV